MGGRNLTPDFRVLDEQEAKLLRDRVLNRVLEEFYQHIDERESDAHLAETLGAGRDDRALAELVLELHSKLQSHPYPLRWLDEVRSGWENPPAALEETEYGKLLLSHSARRARFWAERLEKAVDELTEEPVVVAYGGAFSDAAAQLRRFAHSATWEEMAKAIPTFDRLKAVRGDSEEKEQMKALWKQCKDDVSMQRTKRMH